MKAIRQNQFLTKHSLGFSMITRFFFLYLLSFCMDGVHVCMYVGMHAYGHMCMSKWKPEDDAGYLSQSSLPTHLILNSSADDSF